MGNNIYNKWIFQRLKNVLLFNTDFINNTIMLQNKEQKNEKRVY